MIKGASCSIESSQPSKKEKTTKKVAKPSLKGFPLTSLDNEIIMNLMDHLSITDNACLALTCKFLAAIATKHNSLTIKASTAVWSHLRDPSLQAWHLEVSEFFKRLHKGWIPRTGPGSLRLCHRCSKFRPNNQDYWMVSPFSFVKSSAQSQITMLEKYLQYT